VRCTARSRGSPATTESISTDEDLIAALAASAHLDVNGTIRVNGHDVTSAIRTPEIDRAAAVVARYPACVPRWCDGSVIRREGGIVMEWTGHRSVVFPMPTSRFIWMPSPDERARRRATDEAHAIGREPRACEDDRGRARQRATRWIAPARFHRSPRLRARSTSTPPASRSPTSSRSVMAIVQSRLKRSRASEPRERSGARGPE
jgi:hypothetical protein